MARQELSFNAQTVNQIFSQTEEDFTTNLEAAQIPDLAKWSKFLERRVHIFFWSFVIPDLFVLKQWKI